MRAGGKEGDGGGKEGDGGWGRGRDGGEGSDGLAIHALMINTLS